MSLLRLTCLGSLLVLASCTQSRVPLGTDDGGVRDGGGASCGPTTCAPGLVCCNASCGTCTRPDEGCSTLACVHTCGGDECPQGVFACCPGCPGEADFCAGMGGECPPVACPPPPVCFDGTECGEGQICCPGCSGEGFCVDELRGGCPDIACPAPCTTDDDCGFGGVGLCCEDCAGGRFCSTDGSCPTCPGDECRAMEARGVGFCDAFLGWAWNGMGCEPVSGCGCEGADCGALAMDEPSCEARFAHCASRPCTSDGDCETNEWCNPCAHGSCGGCADCVAACTTSRCATGETATCRQVRPECGEDGTAIVVDGCWLCVDAYTCERFPVGDCRSTGCPDGSACTACFMSYLCLEEGMACAL